VSGAGAAPILIVESDGQLGRAITEQLLADGFDVELARSAEHARALARLSAPSLAVLGSLEAPPGALELLREIRRAEEPDTPWHASLPAIVVGYRGRELEMLRAFEAGADDFLARGATYVELRGLSSSTALAVFSSKRAVFRRFEAASVGSGQLGEAPKTGQKTSENPR
jgi:CheY-like chemotaxis protein